MSFFKWCLSVAALPIVLGLAQTDQRPFPWGWGPPAEPIGDDRRKRTPKRLSANEREDADNDYFFEDETGVHWHRTVPYRQRVIAIDQLSEIIECLTQSCHDLPIEEVERARRIVDQLRQEAHPPALKRQVYDALPVLERDDDAHRVTRRLKCDCGQVIELTAAREKKFAGKSLKCPECGVSRILRPSNDESNMSG